MTQIHRFPDPESLAIGAAAFLGQAIVDRVAEAGIAHVVLAGGSTPRLTYQRLGSQLAGAGLADGSLAFYWGDERCVPLDDPASNFRLAQEALLTALPADLFEAYPMECGQRPEAGAAAYQEKLRQAFPAAEWPRFDLVILGLGSDGHTASLFPGSPLLEEIKRWVAAAHIDELAGWRLSLTPPAINAARTVAFLVQGSGKAGAVRSVMRGEHDPARWPPQIVEPVEGELHWFLDEAAAVRL